MKADRCPYCGINAVTVACAPYCSEACRDNARLRAEAERKRRQGRAERFDEYGNWRRDYVERVSDG